MKRKLLSINKIFRRRTSETIKEVRKISGEMAQTAKAVVKETRKFAQKLRAENAGDQSLINEIYHVSELLETIVEQTERVNQGQTPENRVLSYVDPQARPIKKGKRGKSTEFGHKLQVCESEEGLVTDYEIYTGNPSDKTLLDDVISRHKELTGKVPREFAADRGYYSSANEQELSNQGVKHVSIPRPDKKSAKREVVESNNKFKRLQKFRAGVEGRISCLKRKFCLRRSMLRGSKGTSTWCGLGIFAHNLRKAAQLIVA